MPNNGGISPLVLDPRARRSKAALESAILDLVTDKDLAQISISDITRHAGVNRSTFYEHYTDVHDLAASACTVVFDELIATSPMTDPRVVDTEPSVDNPLTALFAHFALHAQLYRSLLGPDGSARVINHLLHRVRVGAYTGRRLIEVSPSTHGDDPSEVPYDPEAALIAGALVGTVIDWLRQDCPCSPQELASEVWPQILSAASVKGFGLVPATEV